MADEMRFSSPQAEAKTTAGSRFGFALGGAVVATCLIILTVQTWRKWGDMLVDFGTQLYLPWKLSTGAVLYRDISYLTGGPLSQYYHALLFRVFGVSLQTIAVSNLVILFLLVALVYRIFYRMSDVWTATMAGLAFVFVFAFAEYRSLGIFNYVSPYSHELIHGLALSVAVLWLLSRWISTKKTEWAVASGVGFGLVLLTKPEVFLALAVAQATAVVLFWPSRNKPGLLPRSLLGMAAGAVLAPTAFFLYFIQHENLRQSVESVLWAWVPTLGHTVDNEFYRWCMGLTDAQHHLTMILIYTAGLVGILGTYAVLCFALRRGLLGKILLALGALEIGNLAWHINWDRSGYALPGLCLACAGALLWQAIVAREGEMPVLPLLWCLFSIALLGKLGLYPRLWHYGFALAMPAFLTAIYFLLWVAPSFLKKYGAKPLFFRLAVSLGLLIGIRELWLDSQFAYHQSTVLIGHGGDQMLAFRPGYLPADVTMNRVADWLQTHTPPQSTLAVLPDGSTLNYFLRRNNPTGYLRWNPAESAAFGQDNMNQAFIRSEPDYIVLVDFNISQFTIKPFGQDARNGLQLARWIDSHYHPVYETGSPKVTVYGRGMVRKE